MTKIDSKTFDELPCQQRAFDKDGVAVCKLASDMSGKEVSVTEGMCALCLKQGGEKNPDNKGISWARMNAKDTSQSRVRAKANEYFGEGP